MAKVTVKSLHEEITLLKSIIEYKTNENMKLTKEIEHRVNKHDYDNLLKEFENQKKLNKELKEQLDSAEIKLNNKRNVGRKAFDNSEVITMIYNLYYENNSLQKVADELNRLDITTKRGTKWGKSSIRFILLNHKNVKNHVVNEEVYNRTVKLLNDNKKI